MKLVQMRVRGFRRLRDLTVDLDHERVLVVGRNEAGKSTLMEALLSGLYGLSPAKRGSGHAGAVRTVQPWTGEPAALTLHLRMDDGRPIEVEWDFTAERTRVIDHARGEEITADFAAGTHGWIDFGEKMLGLPAGVFRQVTSVGEGQLASLSDEAEIRQAVLQLTDAGVDVLVEQALARLDEATRQATIPRSNSATRRNEMGKQLHLSEHALSAATQAREELEKEVGAIRQTEKDLTAVRKDLARILADEDERETERQRLQSEIDRADGRLAEAELRLAAVATKPASTPQPFWNDRDLEAARQYLVTPPAPGGLLRPTVVAGWTLALLGVALLAVGIIRGVLALDGAAVVVIGAAVYLLTRGRDVLQPSIDIGAHTFADRQALMVALDEERARRDHATQQSAVRKLRRQLDELVALSSRSDDELEQRLKEAEALQTRLQLQLERQRASYDRGSAMLPEVAPLEEKVADLRLRIARLDQFGAAAAHAAATLGAAADEIRRNYAPMLQEYLSRDLARITSGRYTEAVVSDRFEVMLRAPETGSMVPMAQLSRGTQQQVYLLLRLGLLEIMSAGTEPLPLFLDDALALADDGRRNELLSVLEAEARQVIYFTAGETAASIFGAHWHRVQLASPGSQHADRGAGQLPMALVEGPV
ncbi:MAG TPA: AAA family ATPase [Candidatus Dormibacteraeota bacterium]|nr:AAA family ATPase [Candidatus Dormibacteraeota bacterium]